jgi:hypothetical protein
VSDVPFEVTEIAREVVYGIRAGLTAMLEPETGLFARPGPAPDTIQRDLSSLLSSVFDRRGYQVDEFRNSVQSDISPSLASMLWQLTFLARRDLRCPVAQFGNVSVPYALTQQTKNSADIKDLVYDENSREISPLPIADVAPSEAADLMAKPLAETLALRMLTLGASRTAGNVEVSNKAHGCAILHSPHHLLAKNAFGGPSTPVFGYLSPGAYRFGIDNGGTPIWYSAREVIPPTLGAKPPHPVYLPLP